jgi:hypothetical protein
MELGLADPLPSSRLFEWHRETTPRDDTARRHRLDNVQRLASVEVGANSRAKGGEQVAGEQVAGEQVAGEQVVSGESETWREDPAKVSSECSTRRVFRESPDRSRDPPLGSS